MTDIYIYTIENIYQFLGVFFSIIYVVLSIRQNLYCWAALTIAAIFNIYAYYLIDLPLQVIMQFFFIGTAIYGFINWNKKNRKTKLKVTTKSLKYNATWLGVGLLITLLLTLLLTLSNSNYLYSEYPFIDALMFTFNMIPMYLTGKKIIESWIYFIVIDIISGLFYLQTSEFFFCALFFCYIGFASYGYITWKKEIA